VAVGGEPVIEVDEACAAVGDRLDAILIAERLVAYDPSRF
jgi:hypothetical protein